MIIVTRPDITPVELDYIRERVESLGLRTSVTRGEKQAIIGCIGDDDLLREVPLLTMPGVESVLPVMKPYKLAAREFVGENSVVRVGDEPGMSFGGVELGVIAGPCSVENR
ncbi:MAG TPA: hypothetical protein VF167_00130, partial [Longimicrobiaceae bacterium]